MRILFNAAGYKPAYNIGGPVQTLAALAERLVQRGHEVYVSATNSNLTETLDVDTERWHDVNGVKVRYFRLKDSWTKKLPLNYFRKSMADYRTQGFNEWLESNGDTFDIIHSQLPFLHSSRAASIHAERNGIPYVYSQHGVFDPIKLRYRRLKKLAYIHTRELQIGRRANVLLALTEYERDTYRRLGLANPVRVIPNGIDLPTPTACEWPFPEFVPNGPLILFMARLHPLKGVDLAAKAFLAAKIPNAKMVIAGPDEHGLTKTLPKNESVFIAGPVSGNAKAALLQRADVFILPTLTEGFSVAILEALANRCAVVTTPGAYFPELETAVAGVICARETPALAEGLSRAAARSQEMGMRGYDLAAKSYTWETVVDQLEALYMELQGSRVKAAA